MVTGTTTNEATALQKLIGSMDLIKPMLTTALTNKKKLVSALNSMENAVDIIHLQLCNVIVV